MNDANNQLDELLGGEDADSPIRFAEQERPRTEAERDVRHLQTLNDREEACHLLTGMLDAFDERWTAEKRPPPIYYKAQRFLDRMLPERLEGNR